MSLQTQLALQNLFLSPENRPSPQFAAVKPFSDRHRRRGSALSATAFTSTAARPSLYEVLRVKRNASQSEIKSAYRALAKLHHPDSGAAASSDGVDFIAIHEAYATLADPAARAVYDLSIGALRRRSELSAASGFYSTRRWETDQCW